MNQNISHGQPSAFSRLLAFHCFSLIELNKVPYLKKLPPMIKVVSILY